MSFRRPTPPLIIPPAVLLFGFLAVSSGCTTVAEYHREFVHKHDAIKLAKLNNHCDVSGRHFDIGFVRGYMRVAMTGDTQIPLVPDPNYLTFLYDSPQGRVDVATWFQGYRTGVQAAVAAGVDQYVVVAQGRPSTLAPAYDGMAVTPEVRPDAGAENLSPFLRGEPINAATPTNGDSLPLPPSPDKDFDDSPDADTAGGAAGLNSTPVAERIAFGTFGR
ncbi:MAG: hypothetical protein AAF532_12940 [Planctomycetota bacterium]